MAHFDIETGDDGRVKRILRDGEPHAESVSLEQLFSVVTLYFDGARSNIRLLEEEQDAKARRTYGVQSFVLSLIGLEAFTNTYFKFRADELVSEKMKARVEQRHGSVTNKIADLLAMTPEAGIQDQDRILENLHRLSQLRNDLVHPQWQPASVTLFGTAPVTISGLVQNFQAAFEDHAFCREALMWCLLLVARVGRARGSVDASGFLCRWTGAFGLSEQMIMAELGLA